MRCVLGLVAVAGLWFTGCEAQPVPVAVQPAPPVSVGPMASNMEATSDPAGAPVVGDPAVAEVPALSPTGDTSAAPAVIPAEPPVDDAAPATSTPVALADGATALSPDNTKIQFVGLHSGDKPDPRTGGFAQFSGKVQADAAAKTLQAVSVEIDTTSLFTDIPKLTDHLKSPDFFDVREHPTAKFESTKIEADAAGQTTVTGNLTLHGVTKEISFPASVQISDEGLRLRSEFSIDRTEFGMTFGDGKVENKVSMTVVVGEKTQPR